MYIAKQTVLGVTHFFIRESYHENGFYMHRDLMELGTDLNRYLHYPNGKSFYIDEVVEDTLRNEAHEFDYDQIEEMFWPYVRPEIRRKFRNVRSRDKKDEEENNHDGLKSIRHHMFDKRRFLYLKSGSPNQRRIHSIPDKHFKRFNERSRDEIEQLFMRMEAGLRLREIKNYLFVVFDLQRHFHFTYAREMPHALNQSEVDKYFMIDICRLNEDTRFWHGMKMDTFLHDYLKRYIIMFFDADFEKSTFMDDKEFAKFHKRRYYRQHTRPVEEVYNEASKIFGLSDTELKKMTKRALKKLFRQKAQEFHPDKGGDHEAFVSLSRVYDELILRKNT